MSHTGPRSKCEVDKQSLRTEYRAARERITPEEAKTAGIMLAKHLVSIVPVSAEVIAGYRAVRGEIDLFEAMAQLSERGHELCLPVVKEPHAPLIFRRWRIGHKLEVGLYNIEIPAASEPELIPDVVLVPLVAFDRGGHRLGYGAGFYDATVRQLRQSQRKVYVIGVAFALQETGFIPAEAHDERLDAVVTEKGVIFA